MNDEFPQFCFLNKVIDEFDFQCEMAVDRYLEQLADQIEQSKLKEVK